MTTTNENTMKAQYETETEVDTELDLSELEKVAGGVMNGGGSSTNHGGTGSAG